MATDRSCEACDLTAGVRSLPGGLIHERGGWLVEHCVGPLGVGTLVVKPRRHVTAVAALTDAEARVLGPLLRDASAVAAELTGADQVYNCLWSHAGGVPGHIHYVVQPVTSSQLSDFGVHGPRLQLTMFDRGEMPAIGDVERWSDRARAAFGAAA